MISSRCHGLIVEEHFLDFEGTYGFLDAGVIAMTGATGPHNFLNVAQLFGARCVIRKPFTVEEIRRVVPFTLAH